MVVDGDRMKLVKPIGKAVPADLIDAAREHKDELRALAGEPELPPSATIWSREDYRAFYDKATGTLLSEDVSKPKGRSVRFQMRRHGMAEPQLRAIATWALRSLRSRRA